MKIEFNKILIKNDDGNLIASLYNGTEKVFGIVLDKNLKLSHKDEKILSAPSAWLEGFVGRFERNDELVRLERLNKTLREEGYKKDKDIVRINSELSAWKQSSESSTSLWMKERRRAKRFEKLLKKKEGK